MPLKDWFKNKNNSGIKINSQKRSVPDGIWSRCAACNEVIYQKELMDNLKVCPKCDFHFQLTAQERLSLLLDEGSFTEFNSHLQSIDPLQFNASKSYQESLLDAQETTGLNEAVVTGRGKLEKKEVVRKERGSHCRNGFSLHRRQYGFSGWREDYPNHRICHERESTSNYCELFWWSKNAGGNSFSHADG